jgi:phage shock protein PspC (stress-responsive transcriptional regulator)
MKEITRIHIAKIPYDIEITAKKQLEKYNKSLEDYTQDKEVLADIEIRMTELLAERGITTGGVVTSDDVSAIRAQLGEAYEFAYNEGDIAIGPNATTSTRRLYRSTDDAVLAGVLSGIAAYFGVNPLWARLAFIATLFVSFGLTLFVYIVLWIITPPAQTAADKLQLAGKPVTLASIKRLNTEMEHMQPNRVSTAVKTILSLALGAFSLMLALTSLILSIWLGVVAVTTGALVTDMQRFWGATDGYSWLGWLAFGLIIFGGILFTVLMSLVGYAFLAKKLTQRMLFTAVLLVVLGLGSFLTVVGIGATQSLRTNSEIQRLTRTTKTNLPIDFKNVQSVVVDSAHTAQTEDTVGASIQYVVSSGVPRYELTGLPNVKFSVAVEAGVAHLVLSSPRDDYRTAFVAPSVVVYGPALQAVSSNGARLSYTNEQPQAALNIETYTSSPVVSVYGSYGTVTVNGGVGFVDLTTSAVGVLNVNAKQGLVVNAGTVRELTITQPDVCPSETYNDSTSVTVSGVTSGKIQYNGQTLPVASHQTNCGSVILQQNETF